MPDNPNYAKGYQGKSPPGFDAFKTEKGAKSDNKAYSDGKRDRQQDDRSQTRNDLRKKNSGK